MIAGFLAALLLGAVQEAPPVSNGRPEPVVNTGSGLLDNCTYDARASSQADLEFHLGLCLGFIKGVTNAWAEQNPGQICPPDEMSNDGLRDVVVTWLRSHPQSLNAPAVGAVMSATREAFPCDAEPRVDESSEGAPAWPA